MKINLKNNHVMVKEIIRKEDEKLTASGIFIPEETLEDEQVSQGRVVRSDMEDYPIGSTVLFHKTLPVDVNLKIDDDKELTTYFFIRDKDIICSITEE